MFAAPFVTRQVDWSEVEIRRTFRCHYGYILIEIHLKRNLLLSAMLLIIFMVNATAEHIGTDKISLFSGCSLHPANFPGTFNNWGPNASDTIVGGTPSQADSFDSTTGFWIKTVSLPIGAYQYKIYRQRSSELSDWSWILDPLNDSVFTEVSGNQNSVLVVDSLTLFQVCAYPYTLETTAGGR